MGRRACVGLGFWWWLWGVLGSGGSDLERDQGFGSPIPNLETFWVLVV